MPITIHKHTILFLCLFSTFSSIFGQTQTAAYNNQVFLKWNSLFLEIDRNAVGFRPCSVANSLAYMGLSAYESVVQGMPQYNSLRGNFPDLKLPTAVPNAEYFHPAAVNESYYYMMHYYFDYLANKQPLEFAKIDKTYQDYRKTYINSVPLVVLTRSEAFGKAIAKAVCEWEARDLVVHNAYLNPQPSSYTPPVGPGLWQPTAPDFSKAMFPYMGSSRYFALKGAEQLALRPLPYSENISSDIFKQAEEVFNRVNAIGQNTAGSKEDRWIAEFWSDDLMNVTFSPPARLLSIANQAVNREKLNLAECAELYAKLGLALNDANAATWKSKYYYNVERPISYIRRILKKKYPKTENWLTALNNPLTGVKGLTPAFPAYPSGHSAFGGAGGKILSSIFEYTKRNAGTYTFTDVSHLGRTDFLGTPRSFTSFKKMADEDAYSRIPLGVHFKMDCTEGLRLGELAAKRVLELPWKKVSPLFDLAQQPTISLELATEYNRVRLDWVAATRGITVDYFNIQKQDLITGMFETLNVVHAKSATGVDFFNSFDDAPTEGANLYQIEAVFTDGSRQKSDIQQVDFKTASIVSVFPNPSSDFVNIDLRSYEGYNVSISLFNQIGKMIHSTTIEHASKTPYELDLSNTAVGSYLLKIQADGRRSVSKTLQIVR